MKSELIVFGLCTTLVSGCMQGTISDADGNRYSTIRIGKQVWTVENLRTTKFNDGTAIDHVPDSTRWHALAAPGYCYYRNTANADTIRMFGALYNWYCIETEKLAPRGWHVPTDDDWNALRKYLISHGYNWDGKRSGNRIGKALAARNGWKPFTVEGSPGNEMKDNNRSGFSGIAAGYRYDTRDSVGGNAPDAVFAAIRHKAAWWSATPVNENQGSVYGLGFCVDNLLEYHSFFKTCGHSVRLVKDAM